jgi:hypothetical protein
LSAFSSAKHLVRLAMVFPAMAGGARLVRFDNAHAVPRPGGRYARGQETFDH